MTQQDQVSPETSRGHYLMEVLGILCFVLLLLLIGVDIYQGMVNFGDLWIAPILAVLAYLAADFLSGFVHFLADNFGSYDTPIIGPNFIEPFREHHIDPKGIVGNDFVDANGNNSLASLPFMLGVWVLVPLETTYYGYLFGIFSLFLCLAAFLTNQFHKWAHMNVPPAFVGWLQAWGVILSREHHDIHHESTMTPTTA
jgi:cell shape-determining protein MreD